jgi:hypothetical protein
MLAQRAATGEWRARARDPPELDCRLRTSKLAELVEVGRRRAAAADGAPEDDPLVVEAAARAVPCLRDGTRRVAGWRGPPHRALAQQHLRVGADAPKERGSRPEARGKGPGAPRLW